MILLCIFLLISLLAVCGWKGLSIFFSLGLNFFLIVLSLILIAGGFNPLLILLLLSIALLSTTIFINTDQVLIAKTSFYTSIVIIILLIIIIIPVLHFAATQGFGIEDSEEIEGFTLAIGISFNNISIIMIILSSLGAICETSIAVSSGLMELLKYNPQLTNKQILKSGFEIGSKIAATAFNTLFFSFLGEFLTLLIWFIQLHYTFSTILNHKILVGEIISLLIGAIGVIFSVPVTSYFINLYRNK